MRQTLKIHPTSRCAAATSVIVDIARPGAGILALHYAVIGNIGNLRLAPVAASMRADELWRNSCFEAFVGLPPDAPYYEFNFAPSTQWAAYWFSSYRTGMRDATEVDAPRIEVQAAADHYTLQVQLKLDEMTGLPDAAWRLALSVVLEETNGDRSYWALAHPPGKADFHHADGFAVALR